MAENGVEEVYRSDWGDDLVEDIASFVLPGRFSKRDLISAMPVIKQPVNATVFGMDVFTVPPPSSGAALIMAMKFMESYKDNTDATLNAHRLVRRAFECACDPVLSGGGHEAHVCRPFALW